MSLKDFQFLGKLGTQGIRQGKEPTRASTRLSD